MERLLKRSVQFFEAMHYSHHIVRDIRNILDTWPNVPLVQALRQPPSDREPRRRGHQPEPWLGRAERALRAAGVTSREDRHNLLEAVGLKPVTS
jgi:hypothetical protein